MSNRLCAYVRSYSAAAAEKKNKWTKRNNGSIGFWLKKVEIQPRWMRENQNWYCSSWQYDIIEDHSIGNGKVMIIIIIIIIIGSNIIIGRISVFLYIFKRTMMVTYLRCRANKHNYPLMNCNFACLYSSYLFVNIHIPSPLHILRFRVLIVMWQRKFARYDPL